MNSREHAHDIHSDGSRQRILDLFALPFVDFLHRAHETHRCYVDPNWIQPGTLLSIKTGGCSEKCKFKRRPRMSAFTLRSGIFLAPFHPIDEDPTLALGRNIELVEWTAA